MSGDPRLASILKWSLSQSDGTAPARQISEEDRQWFKEAIESQMVDVVKRMKDISAVLSVGEEKLLEQGVTEEDLGNVLDELQEHVESIDMANDLSAIGGLQPLLNVLTSPHASLRAKAAEVLMTMVQNNPKCQESVMQGGGLISLCEVFKLDDDVTARAKAVGAISSLVRHNPEGMSSFRSMCAVKDLLKAVSSGDTRLARKSAHLLKYSLEQCPADRLSCAEPLVLKELTGLLESEEGDLRSSGAEVLLLVAPVLRASSDEKATLIHAVDQKLARISTLSGEEKEDAQDERTALERLSLALSNQGTVTSEPVDATTQSHLSHQVPLLLGGPPR